MINHLSRGNARHGPPGVFSLIEIKITLEKYFEDITFKKYFPVEICQPEMIHIPPEALQIHLS